MAVESTNRTHTLRINRSNAVGQINSVKRFDLLIVGGGVHGAALARQAALAGLSVALLERGDYASATSSRSSKMAHGGLRYLEMFDFQQVLEGIRAREELFELADHLVHPERFLIPVPRGDHFFKFKLGIGLFIYDFLVKNPDHKRRWISRKDLNFDGYNSQREDLEGCFSYTDGLLDDSRLVLEYILAARQNGAHCLNYAEVESISYKGNFSVVNWKDNISGQQYELESTVVANCAGPWAPQFSQRAFSFDGVKYSRGTHLMFDKPWNGPSLFLPMEGKARYYFVWPHPSGTMVGTTEREVAAPSFDPQPTEDEVNEILHRLENDLPHSDLNRNSLHYAFAGERTIPRRGGNKDSTRLSRKHIWKFADGVLTLLGGKLTTANWTAEEGMKLLSRQLKAVQSNRALSIPKLPGAGISSDLREEFLSYGHGLEKRDLQRVLTRYGRRVAYFLETPGAFNRLGDYFFQGELTLALEQEQAQTIEDVMRRRIGMEYFRGHGLNALDQVQKVLEQRSEAGDFVSQRKEYQQRMSSIDQLIGRSKIASDTEVCAA